MKKITTFLIILVTFTVNAQVFSGKGDAKFQVGANMQNGGTGINVTTDFGLGENMSYGFAATYLLNADRIADVKPDFEDRVDLRLRFNANIGSVLNINDALDVYPGLSLGLRNFGGHVGARYFFTDGFGVYSEVGFPIASYKNNLVGFDKYNNQFTFNIGASFNL
ncbi:DUF6646 family protein [Flavobacterium sp.]|uniref:DUF6646 family protein n=1 Tax=Flavobacterium sp. TaxID=239 RepID=UPI003F698063